MEKLLLAAILCLTTSIFAQADEKIDRFSLDAHVNLNFSDMEWVDDPSLPKGGQVSLITGDPSQAGVFMVYVKLPPNYIIPSHTHPFAEAVTVIKGEVGHGTGEKFDREKGEMLGAGSTFLLPANHAHYLWNDEEVIALLVATGPWNITYINPEDDPRNDQSISQNTD